MKNLFRIFLSVSLLSLGGCRDWLDVQPKTSIEERDLFAREEGFKDALTGFYLKMGSSSTYAQNLLFGYLDQLAGRYEAGGSNFDQENFYTYDGDYKGTVNSIYSQLFNIIANINNFLKYIDQSEEIITTPDYRETMKGEALGLRGFLHFDLLRLFGPVFQTDPKGKAVPYRTTFDEIATPILPADEVLDLCIKDLLEAETLLDGHDSEVFGGSSNPNVDAFTLYRQFRMNLWAVRATLARAYLYKGDEESKAIALKYALDVIHSNHFSLTPNTTDEFDEMMATEHIFSLYIQDYYKIVNPIFVDEIPNQIMACYQSTKEKWFGLTHDYRNDKYFREVEATNAQGKKCVLKRLTVANNRIPLIRLSEMYYIAAECEPNANTAISYLQEVLNSRGVSNETLPNKAGTFDMTDLDPLYDDLVTGKTVRINELMKEYLKDFYGEGQLFYFYKRLDFRIFPNSPASMDMHDKYQLPLPDNEYSFGKNS